MLEKKLQSTPCTQRIIYLKNGVKQGNPNLNAKRCGAKARTTGLPCKGMAIKSKSRCRLHGGKSNGAKTIKGLKKCRKANWKHGAFSLEAKSIDQSIKALLRQYNKFLSLLTGYN